MLAKWNCWDESVTNKNAICLVTDRLHAGFLGAMGNSWVRTPSFDRLASESLLFDTAIIDSPCSEELYRGYWQGQHALESQVSNRDSPDGSLPGRLASRSVRSVLLTDDPSIASLPMADLFSERVVVEVPEVAELASSIEETALAQFFAAAIYAVEQLSEPSLVWLHTRGMNGPWDAPLELREAFADEEDPNPRTSVDVPHIQLAADYDPDELLPITQAYAAQVAVWDACLGMLVGALDESPVGERTLLNVVGLRGFPLGEHLTVGAESDALYGELLHVPWVMRCPGGQATSIRSHKIVQPPDLFATLCEWWAVDESVHASERPPFSDSLLKLSNTKEAWLRDRAASIGPGGQQSLWTSVWFWRRVVDENVGVGELVEELFAKPDDRFEVNEVTARCGDICELMAVAFDEIRQAASTPRDEPAEALGELDWRLTQRVV